jgi:hypothetical protein
MTYSRDLDVAPKGHTQKELLHVQEELVDTDLDKDTATAVALSSSIVMDDPTFPDKVVESRPSPTPYDLDDYMETNLSEQLCGELYGDLS